MSSRSELMACKESIPPFLMALAYACNLGLDGSTVSSPTSATASERGYSVLWTTYRIHSMRHMRAHWKISATKIGSVHTDYSSALQWRLVHFVSRSLRSFSHSISMKDQLPHFWPSGVRMTQHTPCCPRAPVYSPSSTPVDSQLSSSHIFQSRST
jgi:hypothetical protein